MHVVLGVLSAVAGLIWALVALQNSGFRASSLNPFLWYRRAQWRKQYGTQPLYCLEDPMDVAAVLILGTAKCEGEISSEQKRVLHEIYMDEFGLDSNAADDLLVASAHLIRNEIYLLDRLEHILEPGSRHFSPAQATSMLKMMTRIGTHDSALNEEQCKLIAATEQYFEKRFRRRQGWQPRQSA